MNHKREDRTPPLARVMGVGRQHRMVKEDIHHVLFPYMFLSMWSYAYFSKHTDLHGRHLGCGKIGNFPHPLNLGSYVT